MVTRSSITSDMLMSSIEDLPPEIRSDIYKHVQQDILLPMINQHTSYSVKDFVEFSHWTSQSTLLHVIKPHHFSNVVARLSPTLRAEFIDTLREEFVVEVSGMSELYTVTEACSDVFSNHLCRLNVAIVVGPTLDEFSNLRVALSSYMQGWRQLPEECRLLIRINQSSISYQELLSASILSGLWLKIAGFSVALSNDFSSEEEEILRQQHIAAALYDVAPPVNDHPRLDPPNALFFNVSKLPPSCMRVRLLAAEKAPFYSQFKPRCLPQAAENLLFNLRRFSATDSIHPDWALSKRDKKRLVEDERLYPKSIESIRLAAKELVLDEAPRGSWKSFVIGRLLWDCVKISDYSSSISVKTVTTSHFESASTSMSHAGVVDFAYCLSPSPISNTVHVQMQRSSIEALASHHSVDSRYLKQPMAIGFKVISSDEANELEAEAKQWGSVPYEFLQHLGESLGLGHFDVPVLPLVCIDRSFWSVLFVHRVNEGDHWHTYVYKGPPLGDVSEKFGLRNIVHSLSLLIAYAENTYRPWLEDIVSRID